jgi:hypothetical protein
VSGDAVDVVARLKEESEVPLRSHGSLAMNRALMAAGLVDRVQLTLFPVITGRTGVEPIFQGAADFDLELIESRTLDGNIQELVYRPTLHVCPRPCTCPVKQPNLTWRFRPPYPPAQFTTLFELIRHPPDRCAGPMLTGGSALRVPQRDAGAHATPGAGAPGGIGRVRCRPTPCDPEAGLVPCNRRPGRAHLLGCEAIDLGDP